MKSSHLISRSLRRLLLMTASTLQKRLLAQRVTVAVPSTCIDNQEAFTSEGLLSLLINKFCCCAILYTKRDTVAPISGVACTLEAGRPTCNIHMQNAGEGLCYQSGLCQLCGRENSLYCFLHISCRCVFLFRTCATLIGGLAVRLPGGLPPRQEGPMCRVFPHLTHLTLLG